MRKILTALTCAGLMATVASADVARVEMGVGAWAQTPSGKISYTENGGTGSDISKESKETQPYVWALLKHPVPVVPNLRLEYTSIESTGAATGTFKEFTVSGGKTSLKMTQFDVIPYYNILDNTAWITLDLGLDFKVTELKYEANGVVIPGVIDTTYSDSTTVVIPLVYVRGRVEIPSTNIGIEADVKYVSYNSNTIYDARAKVDYTLDFIPVIQPAIEVGYRIQKIKLDDSSAGDAKVDLDFSGIYAGLMLRF
ncbi:MAG: TIGR04219 family outer membrane beta-barrel protein [Sulfurimonas sp.]|jgi:outer membrane protein|nr:TIGR04219 family outer membrane beta-barrel protein [Sulfurimonas sp.]